MPQIHLPQINIARMLAPMDDPVMAEPVARKENLMRRSDAILWTLVILFAAAVIWLASTGRLQAVAEFFVDGYLKFVENIVRPIRR